MKQNKMSKYFKYAIGEILLVVIGILIALQINNWNEVNKEKITIKILFDEVLKEIEMNILECERVLQFESTRDSIIQLILDRKLTKQDYLNTPSLGATILTAFDLDTKDNAFLNLSRRSNIIHKEGKELFSYLEFLYNDPVQDLRFWNNLLRKNTLDKVENYSQKYMWFTPVFNEEYSEEATNYFLNNSLYINEVTHYESLHIMQRINAERFMKFGLEFYKKIHAKYHPNENLPEWIEGITSVPTSSEKE